MLLIIEDEPEAAELLKLALKNLGFDAAVASNAHDAVMELAKNQTDLVFLDIALPDKTGLDVLDEIENLRYLALQEDQLWKSIPVVTFSSYSVHEFGYPEERGFRLVDHWQKPVTFSQLSKYSSGLLMQLGFLQRRATDREKIESGDSDQAVGFFGIRDLSQKLA